MRRLAAIVVILCILAAFWRGIIIPWREDRHWRYAARVALETLAELERTNLHYSGRYTNNLLHLSSLVSEPRKIMELTDVFLPGSLEIEIKDDAVLLSAIARDRKKTPLAFEVRKSQ